MKERYRVKVAGTASALPEMLRRLGTDVANTPFQSSAWLAHVYDTFCGSQAKPLLASIEDSQGPLLILPLCIRRKLGFTWLDFADFGVCDYNAPIMSLARPVDPLRLVTAIDELVTALPNVDLLRWRRMPHYVAGCINPLASMPGTKVMDVGAWTVMLPRTLPEYETSLLSKSFRKELQKKLRRTGSRGVVTLRAAVDARSRHDLFELLFKQRQARCEEMGRYHLMSHPHVKDFYGSVLADPACESMVEISALYVDEQPLATMFSLNTPGATFVLMTTFESGNWKSCSLGNIIIHHGVARAIERGAAAFDLTIGDEHYKSDFGASRSELLSYQRYFTAKGRVAAFGVDAFERHSPSEASEFGRILRSLVATHKLS